MNVNQLNLSDVRVYYFDCTSIAGVVKAFDEAWMMDKAYCPKYFR